MYFAEVILASAILIVVNNYQTGATNYEGGIERYDYASGGYGNDPNLPYGNITLNLFVEYDNGYKTHKETRKNISEYLTKFVKKVNSYFRYREENAEQRIQSVKFHLEGYKESEKNAIDQIQELGSGSVTLQATHQFLHTVGTKYHKEHSKLSAVLLLTLPPSPETPDYNDLFYAATTLGGLCSNEMATVVVDDPREMKGAAPAARALAKLLGAVKDGEDQPKEGPIPGSDGAKHCDPKDGYLLGSASNAENSNKVSECSLEQFFNGLERRDKSCWDKKADA